MYNDIVRLYKSVSNIVLTVSSLKRATDTVLTGQVKGVTTPGEGVFEWTLF